MKKFVVLLMMMAMSFSLAACGNSNTGQSNGNDTGSGAGTESTSAPAKKENVEITMWGAEEDQTMLNSMIDSFTAHYADYANFNIRLGVQSESTAKDTILADVEAAADVYAFASDQMIDLIKAGALVDIDSYDAALQAYADKGVAEVKAANLESAVNAATYENELYAFPMSADNGYFLYYDSNVISPEQAASWDSLLEAAATAGKKVGMVLASGWYNASFFFGAGFTTSLNDDGSTAIDWNGAAEVSGVEVVQSMLDIAGHSAFLAISDGDISNQIASGSLAAVISGTWDAEAAKNAFGEGYAATKLPVYTCGEKEIQQGSAAGFKMVGVNPNAANAGWAVLLADWITNEENQTIRFEQREIGPSNSNAAASEAVAENIAIAALGQQSAHGVVQSVGNKYWDPAKTFGEMIAQGTLSRDDEAGIQAALDTLVEGVSAPIE